MADLRGQTVGGFRILDALQTGAGSQGAVYRGVCEDARFSGLMPGASVALKVMTASDDDPAQWSRLERRTSELVGLNHPNVVKYYGCFAVNDVFHDRYVIVEEFLEGESLKERLARSPSGLDADESLRIARAALTGLDYLSSCGIVHRDVKPGNIFLCSDGTVKLIDFEVARQENVGTTTSASGNLRGTFDYMAPDFATPEFRGDVKSDIFSMGVVLHEMLTGKMPYPRLEGSRKQASFAFMSRWDRLAADGTHPIRIASRVKRLLPGATEVLSRALAPTRANRYDSFVEFLKGLDGVRFVDIHHGAQVYRLLRFIGKGGFGEVFKARLLSTGENVAVKHLLKAAYAARFHREARIMARFRDPCFVQLMDFFVMGDAGAQEAFLVMAFLEGMPGNSLRDAIRAAKGAPLAWADVFRAFARYAHGLAMMHRQGIFHRDVKPSNLYYPAGAPERAAIMDLGIARDEHGTATHGQVPGTLDYMPPEVIVSDNRGDSRMDIFALGLCLYEALTGKLAYPRLPTGAVGYTQFFMRARSRQPPDLSDPVLAERQDVLALIREMTDPDETRRLRDAESIATRLLAFDASRPTAQVTAVCPVPRPIPPPPPPRPAPRPVSPPPSRPSPRPPPPPALRPIHLQVRPQPSPRSPHPAQHQRKGIHDFYRERRVFLNCAVLAAVMALLAIGGYVAFPSIKLAVAKSRVAAVCDIYRTQGVDAGDTAEARWRKRWSPQTGAWLALSFPDFVTLTNKIGVVRAVAVAHAEQERVARAQAEEKTACLKRLTDCRRIDGRLDEANFRGIDGWALPARLDADAQVVATLPVLGRCLAPAVRAKLDREPVGTRRKRIEEANALLRNTWAPRVLPPAELEVLQREVDEAAQCVVGEVGNGCSDTINVGGEEIPPGVTKRIDAPDGRPEAIVVKRPGYQPICLPSALDGRLVTLKDEHFTAAPVRVSVPKLDGDVTCRVKDLSAISRGEFTLLPGEYECTYSKPGHVPQKRSFTVRVNVPMVLPRPDDWRREIVGGSEDASALSVKQDELTLYLTQEEIKSLDTQSKVKQSTWRRCAAKLAPEPIESRQERLDEAASILTSAVAVDRVMTEEEAASLYEAIRKRRRWSVGKVQNDCSRQLVVGGRVIQPHTTQRLDFEEGLPEKWTAHLEGCLPKELMRDFDGRVLRFTDVDFTPIESLGTPSAK